VAGCQGILTLKIRYGMLERDEMDKERIALNNVS
jgi:hypothetical protein